jgi:hypothetical protein
MIRRLGRQNGGLRLRFESSLRAALGTAVAKPRCLRKDGETNAPWPAVQLRQRFSSPGQGPYGPMTGNVPVRMQVAWFDLHLPRHTAGPILEAVLQRASHRDSRWVHVVASCAAAGDTPAATMAEIQRTNRRDFIVVPPPKSRGCHFVIFMHFVHCRRTRRRATQSLPRAKSSEPGQAWGRIKYDVRRATSSNCPVFGAAMMVSRRIHGNKLRLVRAPAARPIGEMRGMASPVAGTRDDLGSGKTREGSSFSVR